MDGLGILGAELRDKKETLLASTVYIDNFILYE